MTIKSRTGGRPLTEAEFGRYATVGFVLAWAAWCLVFMFG